MTDNLLLSQRISLVTSSTSSSALRGLAVPRMLLTSSTRSASILSLGCMEYRECSLPTVQGPGVWCLREVTTKEAEAAITQLPRDKGV